MKNERFEQLAHEAARGDLRPQFNPRSLIHASPEEIQSVTSILLERLFHLSRPIANAAEGGSAMRLTDAGHFFYLIETLRRAGCGQLRETLLVILDEFLELTERSYNELYLWSIVELSRTDPRHVDTFWPAVLALDQRFRANPWRRPAGVSMVDQPYRLCELVFYYYAISTLHRNDAGGDVEPTQDVGLPQAWRRRTRVPSLGRCLVQTAPRLTEEQKQLAGATLEQMERGHWRALYGDAYGMLMIRPG